MKATFLRKIEGFEDGRLYELQPPRGELQFILVSGIANAWGTETYIFPANAEGKITDWGELEGSFRGAVDHERAVNAFLEAQS